MLKGRSPRQPRQDVLPQIIIDCPPSSDIEEDDDDYCSPDNEDSSEESLAVCETEALPASSFHEIETGQKEETLNHVEGQ